ncbi:MAG TPA: cytochrome C oxidase subunit IV family protein [Steroidobacteraceae bacterium]|jgi:cytochrome c oxidase subunit IV|nr:cytochrome C oxidase subunit IV family protein [Steroidobacteraceae bacterium]
MAHAHSADHSTAHAAPAGGHGEGVQHPIRIYLWIWLLLFVFSTFSYLVDFFQLQGYLRWTLIIIFMLLKAGFIVAIFMHMAWERLALKLAILVPPLALLVLVGLMAIEGDYTFLTRLQSFVHEVQKPSAHAGGHAAEQPAAEH